MIFLVESTCIEQPDHPLVAIDPWEEPGRTFRVVPQETGSIENNLSISNMDREDFAESAQGDGVFRGF